MNLNYQLTEEDREYVRREVNAGIILATEVAPDALKIVLAQVYQCARYNAQKARTDPDAFQNLAIARAVIRGLRAWERSRQS